MLLHNFIIDERSPDDTEDSQFFRNFDINMNPVQDELSLQTGELPRAIVSDNNEPRGRRSTLEEQEYRKVGEEIRLGLTAKLAAADMRRPLQHGMRYNDQGNIFTMY